MGTIVIKGLRDLSRRGPGYQAAGVLTAQIRLPEAAYRFCRHEHGVNVVLTGTGNPDHLQENVSSILKPPLPKAALQKLESLFGGMDSLTGG